MNKYDILIIGAGAAGIGAAIAADQAGAKRICVVEREEATGGILNQCIHHGFGLGYFGEDLTGTEYASRINEQFKKCNADVCTGTMVTEISPDRTAVLSSYGKIWKVEFDQCLMACGCRERTLASLPTAGTRPTGIYTAGNAQKRINVLHEDIGDDILILGTGDIGQIVARRLKLNNKNVIAMIEQNDAPGGMLRNRRDCIEKYQIPVILRSTIVQVYGDDRITGVRIRNLDSGEEKDLSCSTLITAMGLIPERDLASKLFQDGKYPSWLHFAGNCEFVHEIVDSVSMEAAQIGKHLADFIGK